MLKYIHQTFLHLRPFDFKPTVNQNALNVLYCAQYIILIFAQNGIYAPLDPSLRYRCPYCHVNTDMNSNSGDPTGYKTCCCHPPPLKVKYLGDFPLAPGNCPVTFKSYVQYPQELCQQDDSAPPYLRPVLKFSSRVWGKDGYVPCLTFRQDVGVHETCK